MSDRIGFPLVALPHQEKIVGSCVYIMTDWHFSSPGVLKSFRYIANNLTSNDTELAILRPQDPQSYMVVTLVKIENTASEIKMDVAVETGDVIAIIAQDASNIGLSYGISSDNVAETSDMSSAVLLTNTCHMEMKENDTVYVPSEDLTLFEHMVFPLIASFEPSLRPGSII